ncbi:hypothetical protein JCM3775_003889 [Rhodotorula graminis]|uniref:F-box domain-containing protein n=1 Tax=Rhodotorula graminis (strain WP1) TaxID=578459 RepID=A0A194S6C9_RHOGW|nr:uncharacterized protein RHOBADRAFT_52193 [Rhodotorula graminis WP1]KPV76147.1 hypothetical protein RHOBADRAFT_52193 [Rhodotorula graminis WP1]
MCSTSLHPPVGVHDLPEELLACIFSHLAPSDGSIDLDTLKSCSLAHSTFREPAQKLLWEAVELETEDDVRQWTATRSRRRAAPKELALHAFKTRKGLARLLDGCDGLRWLMFATPNRDMDPAVLAHPSLHDLRTLIVQGWLHKPQPALVLPFRLHTLVLADLYPGSPNFAAWLDVIAHSSLPSIRSISLPACSAAAHPAVAAALAPFAPRLEHLGLSIATRDDSTPYTAVLDAASSLNSLECTSLPAILLAHLPLSLTVLATTEDARSIPADALRDVFERPNSKLQRLYFACSRYEFLNEVEGGRAMVEAAGRRAVDWRFQGEAEE